MADGGTAGQAGDGARVRKRVADQAKGFVGVEAVAIEGGDAGGFLAAMLERVQAECRDRGGVWHIPDAEDAAFLVRLVVIMIVGELRSRERRHLRYLRHGAFT